MVLPTGVGESGLQAPKVDVARLQIPLASRCSEAPMGVEVSAAPISMDVRPAAGPLTAVTVPSYDRNSTTWPAPFTRAMASGDPFWMPSTGYATASTPRVPQDAGNTPDNTWGVP